MARAAPCLPAARGARRDPRRPLRRRPSAASSTPPPEAIALLREARRKPRAGDKVSLSGADPLNLVGILTPGARLPALAGNRVLYSDGVPIALLAGGEVSYLSELPPPQQWEARNLLLRRQVPPLLADLA